MKCTNCGLPNSTKKVISHGKILTGCGACLPTLLQQGDSASFDRKWQQKQYRRELTQPNQREYAAAYPADFIERYGLDAYRKYS